MRWFVRQSLKGERVCAFNQYCKPYTCDDLLGIITEELTVKVKNYDDIEACLKYKKKHFKVFEKEYESKFNEYRDEDKYEREK